MKQGDRPGLKQKDKIMAETEKKSWKERVCDECDFCVHKRCRKRPLLEYTQYPVVAGRPACSEFEEEKK